MLVSLLYASRAKGPVEAEFITSILTKSREKNERLGITGVLCTSGDGVFLQLLEGGREEVNALYNKIVQDTRHEQCTLLNYEEIEERRFSCWRMGRVDLSKVNLSTVLRFSEKPKLDPFSMSGRGALALLDELEKTAAILSQDS
ncbi:MAG: BLUF domain-containing protein [Candidatus Eisenbacteria bacterium]|uniref:BLUF domain-containing protein n=1 Tax=Eiseniibacteriota bacterium TaxID=2212470 RepID=A0A956NE57_UNCEI|nr:BLUF domain-containing protein [Candidatus Eisenbacteria bacterium]MCB9465276.1 BLUF domain-containing protein [Candidatus Eisenbacteria bacterium]